MLAKGTVVAVGATLADAAMVLAFVAIGRSAHHASGGLGGLASTAWPFLSGLAIGELATRSWRRPIALAPTGIGVWLVTVAAGMTLRVLAGQGTAPAFIGVALAFLGLFLLGWRLALARLPAAARTAVRAGVRAGDSPR